MPSTEVPLDESIRSATGDHKGSLRDLQKELKEIEDYEDRILRKGVQISEIERQGNSTRKTYLTDRISQEKSAVALEAQTKRLIENSVGTKLQSAVSNLNQITGTMRGIAGGKLGTGTFQSIGESIRGLGGKLAQGGSTRLGSLLSSGGGSLSSVAGLAGVGLAAYATHEVMNILMEQTAAQKMRAETEGKQQARLLVELMGIRSVTGSKSASYLAETRNSIISAGNLAAGNATPWERLFRSGKVEGLRTQGMATEAAIQAAHRRYGAEHVMKLMDISANDITSQMRADGSGYWEEKYDSLLGNTGTRDMARLKKIQAAIEADEQQRKDAHADYWETGHNSAQHRAAYREQCLHLQTVAESNLNKFCQWNEN